MCISIVISIIAMIDIIDISLIIVTIVIIIIIVIIISSSSSGIKSSLIVMILSAVPGVAKFPYALHASRGGRLTPPPGSGHMKTWLE